MKTALYLFTHDLRLDDNPALAQACKFDKLICTYCVDERQFKPQRYNIAPIGSHRWQFIHESIHDLHQQLQALGQHLQLCFGSPLVEIEKLIISAKVDTLIVSKQIGWDEIQTLKAIQTINPDLTIEQVDTYTLFNQDSASCFSKDLPKQYTPFRRMAESLTPPSPIPAPRSLPPPALTYKPVLNLPTWLPNSPLCLQKKSSNFSHGDSLFIGGELAAIKHAKDYFHSEAPSTYKQTRNALSNWDSSSKMSAWLNQGCLSARRLKANIDEYELNQTKNDSTEWLYVELLWREYFQWLSIKMGTQLFSFQGLSKRPPLTSFYSERFRRWCEGETTYPIVNACMQELKHTGYLSNRGRQIAASCLVNELSVDWRYGAAWFEHCLIDYDVAANWGNWQYIAGVGVDPRGGRHFNLEKQTQQYDPDGSYQAKWCQSPTPRFNDSVDAADWPIMQE